MSIVRIERRPAGRLFCAHTTHRGYKYLAMEIHYCDGCGIRMDLSSDKYVNVDDQTICEKCAAAKGVSNLPTNPVGSGRHKTTTQTFKGVTKDKTRPSQ